MKRLQSGDCIVEALKCHVVSSFRLLSELFELANELRLKYDYFFFLISFFPYAGTIIIIIINDDQGWRDGRVAGKDVVGRSSIQIIVLLVLSQNM